MEKATEGRIESVSLDTQTLVIENVPYNEPLGNDPVLYSLVIDSLTENAVFAVSPSGDVLSWYAGAEKTFGYTSLEMIGRSCEVLFIADDVQRGAPKAELEHALTFGKAHHDRWFLRKDQTRFWGTNTVQPIHDPARLLVGFTKLVHDSTASHLALEALSDSEQQLRLLIDGVSDFAIFSLELDGTIKTWNTGGEKVFGYTTSEIVGRNFALLFSAADRAAGVPKANLHKATLAKAADVERWFVRKDGSSFLGSGKLSQLERNPTGGLRGFVKIVHDITGNFAVSQELRRQAEYDELTELPNRRLFYERVQRAIASMRGRRSQHFAVLFVDVDHFKTINDRFGHVVADQLLVSTAERLETSVRSRDIVARIGGDEFAILLADISGPQDASDAAERIRIVMLSPVIIECQEITITVSIGIAIAESKHERADDIIRDADLAMYRAKAEGRGRAAVFDSSMATQGAIQADPVVVDRIESGVAKKDAESANSHSSPVPNAASPAAHATAAAA